MTFEPTISFLVPLERCIYLAIATVMQNSSGVDAFYRRHALKLLRVCLSSVLNLKGNIAGEGVTPGHWSTMLMSSIDPSRRRTETLNLKDDQASQHLLSLLQKGDQKSSMTQDLREKYVAPKGADQHEDTGNAEKVGYPEKIWEAQTLELLFGKAFMKGLRSADAPVSVKPPVSGKSFSSDVSLGGNELESSFTVSLNSQKSLPNAEFETGIDKLDVSSSSMKMNMKDGKRVVLQSQQLSLDGNAYRSDQDLWPNSSNRNIEIQSSIGNSQFENAKGIGTGNFALLGTVAKAKSNAMDEGEYSSSLISDFGS